MGGCFGVRSGVYGGWQMDVWSWWILSALLEIGQDAANKMRLLLHYYMVLLLGFRSIATVQAASSRHQLPVCPGKCIILVRYLGLAFYLLYHHFRKHRGSPPTPPKDVGHLSPRLLIRAMKR